MVPTAALSEANMLNTDNVTDEEFDAVATAYYDELVDIAKEELYGEEERDEPETCSICDGYCGRYGCYLENDPRAWYEAEQDRLLGGY